MVAVGVVMSPRFFRVVRVSSLEVAEQAFIEGAVTIGCSRPRILLAHVLPNAWGPLVVEATLGIGTAVLYEASLSFLGYGVQPPTATWGGMLAAAQSAPQRSWLLLPPGIAVTLTVLSFSVLGDALRDALVGRRRSNG
jgi:peptide/nickel transport system permease protein